MCEYNPVPTRVWSRVQNPCTFINENDVSYGIDYQLYKGNVLQYKSNSAHLTKSQRYSQLAKGVGHKVFATQSQTYSNPNTSSLSRVNYNTYAYPNNIVGAPNNISGPFSYNVTSPDGCPSNTVIEGGTLVCGTYANQCTQEVYKNNTSSPVVCNSSSSSNVPGNSTLCWDKRIQPWFPRSRYTMNNSANKWPTNYKGFVSAVNPDKVIKPSI